MLSRSKPYLRNNALLEKSISSGHSHVYSLSCDSAVHEQRDAAECLEMILNKVSPAASEVSTSDATNQPVSSRGGTSSADLCVHVEVFKGELMYTTTCKSNNHIINEETNPFWTLPLSLTDDHHPEYSVVGHQRSP